MKANPYSIAYVGISYLNQLTGDHMGYAALEITSLPVFRYMGVRFFSRLTWALGNLYALHPVTVHAVRVMPGAEFGGAVFFVGTALTSAGAIIVATEGPGFFGIGDALLAGSEGACRSAKDARLTGISRRA